MLLGGTKLNGAAANLSQADSAKNNKTIVQIAFSYAFSELSASVRERPTVARLIASFESLFPEMRGLFKNAARMGDNELGIGIAIKSRSSATPASIVVRNAAGDVTTEEEEKLDIGDTIQDEYTAAPETEDEQETTDEPEQPVEEEEEEEEEEDQEQKLDLGDSEGEGTSVVISSDQTVLTFEFNSPEANAEEDP
nr:uncharacterized protein LOC129283753 [Lytechinus pictus]